MALPSAASKANCDASTDDPKLAILTDLAGVIDKFNLLLAEVQPISARLTTLSGITSTQATDLAALSTFMGTVLNDASAAVALATLGVPLNTVDAKSAAYTVISTDRGKLIDYTSGSYTLSLTAAATLGAGFVFAYRNSGTGTLTIDPDGSEQIDGATTLSIAAGESGFAVCNGTAWKTVGRATTQAKVSSNDTTPGYLNGKLVAGTNVTLTEGSDGADETLTISASGGISTDVGAGGVGMIALMYNTTSTNIASGGTIAGSSLQFATAVPTDLAGGGTASGTWRNVTTATLTYTSQPFGTYQRIA